MATEKDFVKRIVKEMVDYYLYHELYDVTAHVVYVPHEKSNHYVHSAVYKITRRLRFIRSRIICRKHLELDSMYSSLMGSHNRDKTIASLVNVLMIMMLKSQIQH